MKKLKLEPVAKDYRGESWRVLFPDNREVLLIFTKAGFLRGGHSHSKREISLLLTGRVRTWKIMKNTTVEVIAEKSAGEFMINEAGDPHLTLALEDYWLLDWKIETHIGESKTTNYPPYRAKVHAQLKAQDKEAADH